MEKDNIKIIDLYIKLSRKVLSTCSESFDADFSSEILNFLGLKNISDYSFIIDSLYLLEDTQLAKHNYIEFGAVGPTKYENFGEIYLRVYGILNACYLQQQAVIAISEKLGIEIDIKELKEFPLFDLRNNFAAHTPSRGYKDNKRSYILDRHALLEGKLKGYCSNAKTGFESKDANIIEEITKWDVLLVSHLHNIAFNIVKNTDSNSNFESVTPNYSEVFKIINEMSAGNCLHYDIWSESNLKVNFV